MLNGPPGAPWSTGCSESKDGQGAGDCNRDYVMGDHLTTGWHGLFTVRQFARLQCLRSHVQDGDRVPESLVLEHPERFGLAEPQ